jgi:NAD-dependent SIR2 family protein deacetylase
MFSARLIERLTRANSVAVLTGAGISAESGIAILRDPGGRRGNREAGGVAKESPE